MKTVAGIDLGTQSMKVVIYDYESKEIIEKASCPMELISDNDGTREQKTEWFDKGLEVCFGKLSPENKKTIEDSSMDSFLWIRTEKLSTTSNFGTIHPQLKNAQSSQKRPAVTKK